MRAVLLALATVFAVVVCGCTKTNLSTMSAQRSGESTRHVGAKLSNLPWQEHVVGDTARTRSGNTVTVHRLDANFRRPGGGRFALAAADIEACARRSALGGVAVSPKYFLVQVGPTTRAPIQSFGVKEPLLGDELVQAGTCKRGWVVFQLRDGDRPTAVLLATSTFIRWRVAKARPSR